MKDQPLEFNHNEDKTIVKLAGSDVEELGETIKSVMNTHSKFLQLYDEGKIDNKILAKFEADIEHILTYFKFDQKREEDRIDTERRAAYKRLENDALRQQLSIPPTSEDVRERLKLLTKEINVWWDVVGLGFLKMEFTPNRLILELSGVVLSGGLDQDGNKLDKEQKVAQLKEIGFQFCDGRDTLLLNEANTNLLSKIIKDTFPNGDIRKIENMKYGGQFIMRDVEVSVPYKDLDTFEFSLKPKHTACAYNHLNLKTEREKVVRSLRDLSSIIHTLVDFYNSNKLETGFSETLMACLVSYTEDLFSIFDYKGIFHQHNEAIHGAIRAANNENREIRAQLGRKVGNTALSSTFKEIEKKLNEWWGTEVGHISSVGGIRFHEYGVDVVMSCLITDYYEGDVEIDQDQKFEKLKRLGISFDTRTERLCDTDANKAYIKKLLDERFGTDNYSINSVKSDWQNLQDIEISIQDLDTI
jgi:hypothetical protein